MEEAIASGCLERSFGCRALLFPSLLWDHGVVLNWLSSIPSELCLKDYPLERHISMAANAAAFLGSLLICVFFHVDHEIFLFL